MAGLAGIIKFNIENELHGISKELYYLLFGLQNRGQASAKAITQMKNPSNKVYYYSNGVKYVTLENIDSTHFIYAERKGDGIVRELFGNKVILDLYGESGIGGVSNYQVYKSASLPYRYKMVAVGKDGFLENSEEIKQFLVKQNIPFKKESSEVEIFSKLFHYHYLQSSSGAEAMKRCVLGFNDTPGIKGLISALALIPSGIVAFSNGKPLGYIYSSDAVYFASESAGPWSFFKEMNSENFSEYWHDIEPGEIFEFNRDGTFHKDTFKTSNKMCSFEWAYFARPSTVIYNEEAGDVRKKIGKQLVPKIFDNIRKSGGNPNDCIVVPVLDSGNWYGIGVCEGSKLSFIPGLYKNKYSLKSFILDYQENRDQEVLIKHIPSVIQLRDKEIILVDDSIVRGTTMRIIVEFVKKKARPSKIHVVAGYPEKRYACPYTSEGKDKLIANEMTTDMIRDKIGADTLTYGEHHMWHGILGDDCCYKCEKRVED